MRKSKFYILALTAALIMPLSSCKETIIYVTPEDTPNDDIKTPIELSVGGVDGAVSAQTRASSSAVITKDETRMIAFPENTNIFMIMQSEYGQNDFNDPDNPHKLKTTVARGTVTKNDTKVSFDATNQRYWDDAHARSSQLAIWAYAQMTKTGWTNCKFQKKTGEGSSWNDFSDADFYTNTQSYDWRQDKVYPGIKEWNVTHYGDNKQQDGTSILCQDLLFSNNIANNTDYSKGDNRLKFDFGTRKFPNDNKLYFRHALSKITIHIKEGDGFIKTGENANSDFKFASGTNVKLSGFNTKGAFNIKEGEFQWIWNHYDIPSIYNLDTPSTGDAYTLEALAIPNIHKFMSTLTDGTNPLKDEYSRFVKDVNAVMMEFTIDGNHYKITSGALYNALHTRDSEGNVTSTLVDNATETNNYVPLEAGKNYIFTFVVGKTKIEHLTATVAEWEDVEAESYTPIIDVNQTYGVGDATALNKTYTLLRSTTKAGSYSTESSATMTYAGSKYTMAPQLYWPDHKTHYFFRGVYPKIGTTATGTGFLADGTTPALANEAITTDNDKDVIAVKNAAYTEGTYPSDLMIGIPRKADGTPDEKCKVTGTNHGSSVEGICATSGTINLNFRYAMSQVEVRLTTTTGDAAVNLTNAKVEIVGGYKQGKIKLEDGSVVTFADSDKGDFELAKLPSTDTNNRNDKDGNKSIASTNVRHSSVIPQSLTYDSSKPLDAGNLRFKITITNTDGSTDIYYADIKPIDVTVGSSTTPTSISNWEAGKHYIYFLDLRKTEIKVSATITDWVTATGSTNVWF